jgi:hypothetical protein
MLQWVCKGYDWLTYFTGMQCQPELTCYVLSVVWAITQSLLESSLIASSLLESWVGVADMLYILYTCTGFILIQCTTDFWSDMQCWTVTSVKVSPKTMTHAVLLDAYLTRDGSITGHAIKTQSSIQVRSIEPHPTSVQYFRSSQFMEFYVGIFLSWKPFDFKSKWLLLMKGNTWK